MLKSSGSGLKCLFAIILPYTDTRQVIFYKIILHLVLRIVSIQRLIQHRPHLPAQAVAIRHAPEFLL